MPAKPKIWTAQDIPDREDMAAYLARVQAVRDVLPSLPEVPPDMDGLSWEAANGIERILVLADEAVTNMKKNAAYCGEISSGGF